MNKNKINISLILLLLVFLQTACKNHKNHTEMAGPNEYYTCSMDPQVIENKAGNCPICHMKLIKVNKNTLKAGQIKLSAQQIKLGNITCDTIRINELTKGITITGKVTIDQNFSNAISTRIEGRINKLVIKNVGDYIEKGQLLYEIYSEDMNASQQEYLLAIHNSSSLGFADAAKNKLLLNGMSESQIGQLKKSGKIIQSLPIYSAESGYLNELFVVEGNYVSAGTTLFHLVSFNSVWVEAQVYLPYLNLLRIGTEANFSIPAIGDKSFSGKVIFINPQVQSTNRFVLARFKISNPSQQLKPGMLANITLQTEMKKMLTIPSDAIIQDSRGTNVWVRKSEGVFENKMITIGMQNNSRIEITSGLSEGDVVVVTGAYLLNSEYVFKRGANPMEGHSEMPGMKM